VLTGSVQRTGDDVRLTVNLVDARALVQLASWNTAVPVSGLPALMDETVEAAANMLNVAMAQPEKRALSRERASNGSAHDLYLKARGALQRYDKRGNIEAAIDLLRKAIDQDPKYAAAHSSLSEAYWRKYRESKNLEDLDEARDLGLRATQLDERIASAHATLGAVFATTGDSESAAREYSRALQLDPVNQEARRGLAQAFASRAKFAEAEAAYREAIRLRPNDWITLTDFGTFLTNRARYREAEAAFLEVARMTPDNAIAFGNLASVHLSLREFDRAAAEALRAIELHPSASAYLMLANVRFEQRRYREAADWNEKASALASNKSYTILGNLADSYRWTPELSSKAPETYRRAMEIANRAVATNPRNGYAVSCLSLYSAKLGEKAAAERQIRKALELAPQDVRVLVNSIVVYELIRQRPRALQQLVVATASGYPEETILNDPELASLRGSVRNN
jgi:serine/threonine-protein kinase